MKLFITWRKKKETQNEKIADVTAKKQIKTGNKIKELFIDFSKKIKSNQKIALASVLTLSLIAFSLCTVSYFSHADNNVFYAKDFVNNPTWGYANVIFEYGEYPQKEIKDSTLKTNIENNGSKVSLDTWSVNRIITYGGERYWSYDYGDGYIYYLFEPIKWRILSIDEANDEVLAVSDYCLDAKKFGESSDLHAWDATSPLHIWLNDTFANHAGFDDFDVENDIIEKVYTPGPSGYDGTGISERFTLLSYDDLFGDTGVNYGFLSENTNEPTTLKYGTYEMHSDKTNRLSVLTDYTDWFDGSTDDYEIYQSTSPYYYMEMSEYWTRSFNTGKSMPCIVRATGYVYNEGSFGNKIGLRPVATFKLSSIKDKTLTIKAGPRRVDDNDQKKIVGYSVDGGAITKTAPTDLTVEDATDLKVTFNDGSRYYITYDPNGGTSGEPMTQEVVKANYSSTSLLSEPTYSYKKLIYYTYKTMGMMDENPQYSCRCNLKEWNTKADGTGISYDLEGNCPNSSSDITLYAIYEDPEPTPLLSITPTDESGAFLGWYNAADRGNRIGGAGDQFTPTDDIILYAHWEKIKPDILNAGDLVTWDEDLDVPMGYMNVYFEYGEYPQTLADGTSGLPASPTDYQVVTLSSGKYMWRKDRGKSTGHWYKFEPIKWRILQVDNTDLEVFAVSEFVLDSQIFSSTTDKWNKNTDLNVFLNGKFYDAAFSKESWKPIKKMYVNEGVYDADKIVSGRVSILSSYDYTTWGPKFGFTSTEAGETKQLKSGKIYYVKSEQTNRVGVATDLAYNTNYLDHGNGQISLSGSSNDGKKTVAYMLPEWSSQTYYENVIDYDGSLGTTVKEHFKSEMGVRPAITLSYDAVKDLPLTIRRTGSHDSAYSFGGYTFNKREIIDLDDLYNTLRSYGGLTLNNLPYLKAHFGEGTFEDNVRVYSSPSTTIVNNDGTIEHLDDPSAYVDLINTYMIPIPGFDIAEYLRTNGEIKLHNHHDLMMGWEPLYSIICNQLQAFMFTTDGGATSSGELELDDSYYWKDHEWLEDNDGNKLYEIHYGVMGPSDGSIEMTYDYHGDIAGTHHTVYRVPGTESEYYIDDPSNGTWDESEYRWIFIRPKYKLQSYTVNFDANTGRGKMKSQTIKFEDNDSLNANKFKKGVNVSFKANGGHLNFWDEDKSAKYKFAGWNTKADGTGDSYENKAKLNLEYEDGIYDITLYAQWDTASDDVTLPKPTRSGYDFTGWYTSQVGGEKIGEDGATFTPLSDTILYAHWVKSGTTDEVSPDMFYASDLVNNPEYGYVNATFKYGNYPQSAVTDASLIANLNDYAVPDTNGIYKYGVASYVKKDDDYFKIDPIVWRILSIDYDNREVKAVAENVLDCKKWDDQVTTDTKWSSNPPIRQWLNDDFLNKAFTEDEQDTIIQKFYTLGESNLDGTLISDKVSLLSADEIEGEVGLKYGFIADSSFEEVHDSSDMDNVTVSSNYTNKNAIGSDYAVSSYKSDFSKPTLVLPSSPNDGKIILNWWTKSRTSEELTRVVMGDGTSDDGRIPNISIGVRPAITFDLDAVKNLPVTIDSTSVHGPQYNKYMHASEQYFYFKTATCSTMTLSSINSLLTVNGLSLNLQNLRTLQAIFYRGSSAVTVTMLQSIPTKFLGPDGLWNSYSSPEFIAEQLNSKLTQINAEFGTSYTDIRDFLRDQGMINRVAHDDYMVTPEMPLYLYGSNKTDVCLSTFDDGTVSTNFKLEDKYRWDGRVWKEDEEGNKYYELHILSDVEYEHGKHQQSYEYKGDLIGSEQVICNVPGTSQFYFEGLPDVIWDGNENVPVIRPKFLPNSCTITFDANGGSGTMPDQEISFDSSEELNTNNFTYGTVIKFKGNGGLVNGKDEDESGITFNGWNTNSDGSGTGFADGAIYSPETGEFETKLYAMWGSEISLPTAVKEGATFDGWYNLADGGVRVGGAGDTYPYSSSMTLYAHFTDNKTHKGLKPDIFYASDLSNNPEYGYLNATFEYGEYPQGYIDPAGIDGDEIRALINNHSPKVVDTGDTFNFGEIYAKYILTVSDGDVSGLDAGKYMILNGTSSLLPPMKFEPIKWRILSVDETNGEVFALSELGLDTVKWDDTDDITVSWSDNPYIRRWLNGYFYDVAFSSEEQESIIEKNYPTFGLEGTGVSDKVTLLSQSEIQGDEGLKYGFAKSSSLHETSESVYLTTEWTNRLCFMSMYTSILYQTDGRGIMNNSSSPNYQKLCGPWWTKSRLDNGINIISYWWDEINIDENISDILMLVRPAVTFDLDTVKNLKVRFSNLGLHGNNDYSFVKIAHSYFGNLMLYDSINEVNEYYDTCDDEAKPQLFVKTLSDWKAIFLKGTPNDLDYAPRVFMPFSTKIRDYGTYDWIQFDNPDELTRHLYDSVLQGKSFKELIESYNPVGNYFDSFSHYEIPYIQSNLGFFYSHYVGNPKTIFLSTYNDGTNDITAGDLVLDDTYYWKDRVWAEDENGEPIYELHYMQINFDTDEYLYTYKGDLVGTKHKVYKKLDSDPYAREYYIDDPSNGTWLENPDDFILDGIVNVGAIIRPKYLPLKYTVHYYENGGRGSMPDKEISYDEGGTLDNCTMTGPGYTVTFKPNGGTISDADKAKSASMQFDKWNTKEDGTGTNYLAGVDPNIDPNTLIRDLDLYAIWKAGNLNVTLPLPSKEGYTFDGWYTEAIGGEKVGVAGDTYTLIADRILYAHWKKTGTNVLYKPNIFYAGDLSNNPEYGYVNATFEYGEYPSKLITNEELSADTYLLNALNQKHSNDDYELFSSSNGIIFSIPDEEDPSKINRYLYTRINGVFGLYKYEPIKWRVLSIDYENGEVFAVSEYVLDGLDWNDEADSSILWSDNPKVRRFLNGDFYNSAFTSGEKENIIKKSYPISSEGYEGTETSDFVTLLSAEEVETSNAIKYGFITSPYSNENTADTDLGSNTKPIYTEYTNRLAYPTDYGYARYNIYDIKYELQNASSPNNNKKALNYWLRSRFLDGGVRYVYANGSTNYGNNYYSVIGIRPAITFDLDAIKDKEVTVDQIETRGPNYKIVKNDLNKPVFTWKSLSYRYDSLENILNSISSNDVNINLFNLKLLQGNFYKGDNEVSTLLMMPISTNSLQDDGTRLGKTSPEIFAEMLNEAFPSLKGEYASLSEYLKSLGLITMEDHDDIVLGCESLYSMMTNRIKCYLSTNDDLSVTGEVTLDDSYVWEGRDWAEDADGNKLYELHLCTASQEGGQMKYTYSYKGDIVETKHIVVKVPGENKFYFEDKPEVKWSTDEHTIIIARPKFLPNSNKITLNLEGGEGTESIYTDKEETGFFQDPGCNTPLTELKITIPEKTGYKFEGFFSEENGGGTKYINSDGTFTSNFQPDSLSDGDELYAYWSVITYTINYVLNGATNNASNPSTYTIESSDITIGEPQLPGYSFLKWTGENLGDNTKSFVIPSGSTGNRTYTAVFDVDTYQINYHLSDGEVIDPANPVSYTILTDTFKLNNPVKEHYTFTGWTGANGDTKQTDVSVLKGTTGNLDFYPHFSPVNYQITFDSNGGSSVDPKSVAYGSEIGTLSEPTRRGYTFKGWFRDNSTFSDEVLNADTMSGNFTAYAKWEIITYTITYHLDGGELAIGKSNPTTYTVETPSFTLENPTKAGYAFDGWHLDGYLGAMKPVVIHTGDVGDRDYTAKYSIRKFNLTFDSNGGSSVNSKQLDYNSQFGTLDAPTRNGYTFKGWFFDDDTFQNEATSASLITDDTELHAKWEATTYQITYSGLEDATVSGNPTSYTIESGQIVLSAPTKVGYDFEGWTGSNGTTKQINVTIPLGSTGDKSYVANWKVKQLTVGFDSNGGSNITSKTLSYGDTLGDLTIPTKDRALFAGWYKDAMFQNKASSTDTAFDNMTLHALWYDVAPIDPEVYCASQIKPSLTVIDSNSNTINVPNADVNVTYGENINAGEGTVTLTGFGNSKEIKFKINKKIITQDDIKIADSDKEIVKYKNGTVNTKTNVDVTPFVKLASCNNEEVILNYSECFISDTSGNPVTRTTRNDKTANYDNIKVSGLSVSNSNYQLEPLLTSKIFEGYSQLVDNTVPKLEEILVINSKKMKKGDTLKVSVRFSEELDLTSDIFNQIKNNFIVRFDFGDEKDKELKLDSYTLVNSKTVFNFTFQIPSDLEDEKEFALTNFNFIKLSGADLKDIAQNILDLTQTGITTPSGYYVSTKKETPVPSGGGGGGGGAAGPVYTVLPVDDSIKVNKSYMNGYENKTFRPNDPVSREEVAAIVARLDGEFGEDFNFTSFNDFEDALNRWSKNYIGFCKYKDLFHGYEDGSFHPTSYMTRAELATLVSNFLRVQNTDFEKVDLTKPAFSDVDGRWYEESVNKLAHLGILNGYEDGTFKGDNPVSRIEVAIVMNKINKKIVPDDKTFKTVKKEIAKKFKDIKEGTWYFNDVVMATMDYETKLVKTDTSKK